MVGPKVNGNPERQAGHVLVAGFGRVGRTVAALLESHRVAYVALDSDADRVASARRAGKAAFIVPLVLMTSVSPASRKSGRSVKLECTTRSSPR